MTTAQPLMSRYLWAAERQATWILVDRLVEDRYHVISPQLWLDTKPQEPRGPIYVDTQHDDMVHDAQLDYYGAKLATSSSGMSSGLWSQCAYLTCVIVKCYLPYIALHVCSFSHIL